MSNPTLAKLSRPRLFGAVARERLFKVLDAASQHPLTLVDGLPGSGKTTLVASYLVDRHRPTLWCLIDAGDEDIASFFYFLREAALPLVPRKLVLPLFTPEYRKDLEGFSRRFFRSLFSGLPGDSVVVLDNLHAVADDSPLHEVVAFGAQEAPEGKALIGISRRAPAPQYATLLANERATQINGSALPFTEDELLALVTKKYGLPQNSVTALLARTRGWAAGVTLLAQQWDAEAGESPAGGNVTAQSVSDYFGTEIMRPLLQVEQMMIMHTALLPSVSEALAVALCGSNDVLPLLEKLHRRRLFTDRQLGTEQRYRFHDMFREYLWARLRDSQSAQEWSHTLGSAAKIAAQAGEIENAIPLALESGDLDVASELISGLARGLLGTGRFQTLHDWISKLGSPVLERRPWLRYWLGRAQMHLDISASRLTLEAAYVAFAKAHDGVGQLLSAAQVSNTYSYEYVDFSLLRPWIERIDELLTQGHAPVELVDEAELYTARLLAVIWFGHINLDAMLRRAELLVRQPALDSSSRLALGVALADAFTVSARMIDSRRVIDIILPLLEDRGVTPLARIYALLQIGYHMMRAGEDRSALDAWDRMDQDKQANGIRQMEWTARVFRSLLHSGRGNVQESQTLLMGLEAHADDDKPLFNALLYVALVLMEIARGDGPSAARYARISMRQADRLGGGFVGSAWRAHCSAAFAMAGEHAIAESLVEEGLRIAQEGWGACYQPNLLMSLAYSLLLRGERDRAHATIARMLRLARENDWWHYLRLVSNVKDVVVREALRAEIDTSFSRKVARGIGARPGDDPPEQWPWLVKVRTLGGFEVLVDELPVSFSRKAQKRPLELLKALIAAGGTGIDIQALSGLLWPESDAGKPDDAFNVTAHRLRKLLCDEAVLEVRDGKCSLNKQLMWTDVRALGTLLDRVENERGHNAAALAEAILRLYRGHFLENEPEAAWLLPTRERLKARVQRGLSKLAAHLEQAGKWGEAVRIHERALEIDPLAENHYRQLMRCHHASGEQNEALRTFKRCRQVLSVMLGTEPSSETKRVCREIGLADTEKAPVR